MATKNFQDTKLEDKRRGKGNGRRGERSSSERPERSIVDKIGDITLRDVAQTAKVALDVGKEAIALLNPEEKYFDYLFGDQDAAITQPGPFAAGTFFTKCVQLDNPPQGVGGSQREGDSIEGKDIDLSLVFIGCQNAATTPDVPITNPVWIRLMVIQDLQPEMEVPYTGGPTTTNNLPYLFQNSASAIQCMTSMIDYDWAPRFRILLDEYVFIDPAGVNGKMIVPFQRKIRHRQVVKFSPGGTQSSNVATWLCFGGVLQNGGNSLMAGAATNVPIVTGRSRFYYIDN